MSGSHVISSSSLWEIILPAVISHGWISRQLSPKIRSGLRTCDATDKRLYEVVGWSSFLAGSMARPLVWRWRAMKEGMLYHIDRLLCDRILINGLRCKSHNVWTCYLAWHHSIDSLAFHAHKSLFPKSHDRPASCWPVFMAGILIGFFAAVILKAIVGWWAWHVALDGLAWDRCDTGSNHLRRDHNGRRGHRRRRPCRQTGHRHRRARWSTCRWPHSHWGSGVSGKRSAA